jgi:two-component system response regulator FixJ
MAAVADNDNDHPPRSIVCVVDPDQALTQRLAESLAALGARVRTYATGAAMLADAGPGQACVIAEARLPDMTGMELIAALRARGLRTPVILQAAEADVATAVAGMRAGALDFIEKPQGERLLAWHVRRLLDSHESTRGTTRT